MKSFVKLLLGSCLSLMALSHFASAGVVSTGVGTFQGNLVTSRFVQMYQMLQGALEAPKPQPPKLLALDSKAFAQATQSALLGLAVSQEAENFNVVQVDTADIIKAKDRALKQLKTYPTWKQLEPSDREIVRIVRVLLQNQKFVQFRAQSSVIPITDNEAQRYYNENRLKFGDVPFENLKENIKTYLNRTQVERRLKDWYEVLLGKYQAKNLIMEL